MVSNNLKAIVATLCVEVIEVGGLSGPKSSQVRLNSKVCANQVHQVLSLMQF